MSEVDPGVNVVGYVDVDSGLGELSRGLLAGLSAAGIECATTTWGARPGTAPHRVTIACIKPDDFVSLVLDRDPTVRDQFRIVVWAWETEAVPRWIRRAAVMADEVWTLSRHAADALRAATGKPTFVFTPPITPPGHLLPRPELGLPAGVMFLFCFDFLSVFERKNPVAVVDAFKSAFPEGDGGAYLVIKSVNGDQRRPQLEELRAAAGDRADIHVLDGHESSLRQHSLIASCDAYISLHRAEGFGLTMGEAMSYGKPVIATAYSGNLDFMTPENSALVPFRMVEVPPGCSPFDAGTTWAEPSVADAARLMRRVVDDPGWAATIGACARQEIAAVIDADASIAFLRDRVAAASGATPPRRRVPFRLRPSVRRAAALLRLSGRRR